MNDAYDTTRIDNVNKRKWIFYIMAPVLTVCGVFFANYINSLAHALKAQRAATERMECSHNMKAIALAFLAYEADYGEFPPAFTVDANGNRLHSWRTLLLPYLNENELYKRIDLSKPWNDPANIAARESVVSFYHCPSDTHDKQITRYFVVVDDAGIMTGCIPTKMSDITDTRYSTLLVVEGRLTQQAHWMEPKDLTSSDFVDIHPRGSTKTLHAGSVVVATASGDVISITDSMSADERYGRITKSGNEKF